MVVVPTSILPLCRLENHLLTLKQKGLSLEQIDRMLEEVPPMKSRGWVPHDTFAQITHMNEKGISLDATAEQVHERMGSVAKD